jgi:uncharacterized protein (TIGR03435 family)
MRFAWLIFQVAFLASAADDPVFEVASIKPNKAQSGSSGTHTTNSRLTTENVNLRRLILMAYDLRESQLTGGPAWIDDVGWDIAAKAEKELPKGREGEQVMRAMLRSLLAERFQLRLHKEMKELSVYALTVGKNGAKLTPSASEGDGSSTNSSNDKLEVKNITISRLTEFLANRMRRIVIDDTGLTGKYDFKIEFAPDGKGDGERPDLLVAIQEQLGLKIESRKAPVDVYIVDGAEKPNEN